MSNINNERVFTALLGPSYQESILGIHKVKLGMEKVSLSIKRFSAITGLIWKNFADLPLS